MNVAVRLPDTAQSRRLAVLDAFDKARIEEQRARSAKDDFAKRIFRKELPADSERVLERLDADLELAIIQKRQWLDHLLDTHDDLRTEQDVTFEMKRAVRALTAPAEVGDPNDEHRLGASDVVSGAGRL